MKTKALILLLAASSALAQGTFQNLDFEAASLVPIAGDPYGRVLFAPAFPGWTGYVGTNVQGAALYNNVFLDSSGITVIDHNWTNSLGTGGLIEGNFTAILQAGVLGGISNPQDATLSQSGTVPATAKSLVFKGLPIIPGPGGGALVVTLGGQQLSVVRLATGSNYYLYGADIQQWAGQTAELDFTLLPSSPHVNNNYFFLDSIDFSSSVVPEPSALALSILGILLMGRMSVRRVTARSTCLG